MSLYPEVGRSYFEELKLVHVPGHMFSLSISDGSDFSVPKGSGLSEMRISKITVLRKTFYIATTMYPLFRQHAASIWLCNIC